MSDIHEKLRKLFAVVNGEGTQGNEAANAMAAAKALMAKHHIDSSEIKEVTVDRIKEVTLKIGSKRVVNWERILASFLMEFVDGIYCVCFKGSIRAIGLEKDLEIFENLWYTLHEEIEYTSSKRYGTTYRKEGASYAEGFCVGMSRKLMQNKLKETKNTSTSLVILKKRKKLSSMQIIFTN